jgi:phosphoglucosamine mutase
MDGCRICYDGDADRCLAVDEKGNIVNGDGILYICGRYMKEKGELKTNTVVTTVMSNFGLYKSFDKAGIQYEKTDVGDKYVCENMLKNGHFIGGEQSGHIIFAKHATTGDGILTSLKIMEVMLEKKETLSELAKELEVFPQLLLNIKVIDKKQVMEDEDVLAETKKIEAELGEDGRVLLRASGTENLIRIMVEAKTQEICNEKSSRLAKIIRDKGYEVK